MASLPTHFSAFVFLFPIGFRRLLSSFSLYLKSPALYRSRVWYLSESKWKNLDLYGILIILPIAAFSEVFWFLTFSGHPTYRFAFFQQSAVLSLFWLVAFAIVLRENFDIFLLHENLIFLFAAIAFLVEYSVIGLGITGLGGHVYALLSACTLLCAASCLFLAVRPTAFFADVALSSGIVFKATWVLQAGLSLFSDTFVPRGCKSIPVSLALEKTDVDCVLDEDRLRGLALINFLFVIHALAIFLLIFLGFGSVSWKGKMRCGGLGSLTMSEIESENLVMRHVPEFELE
ncbi:uncharacterized protein [Aristolochia californica]|uniref:uncharacterized protein n=1 Tax=Aristolochia californica TaxID=171875 RepID=UPI0035E33474